MPPGLMRRDTGDLANEAFTSNPIVSSEQKLLRFKNCKLIHTYNVGLKLPQESVFKLLINALAKKTT